jgi:hypothetical protein
MSDMMGGLPGGEKIQFENNIFVIICPFTSSAAVNFFYFFSASNSSSELHSSASRRRSSRRTSKLLGRKSLARLKNFFSPVIVPFRSSLRGGF